MKRRSLIFSLITIAIAFLFGLTLHVLRVFLRDKGPSFDGISCRDNGALIILPVVLLGLISGEIVCVRRRAWLAVVLLPLAVFTGLFVSASPFEMAPGACRSLPRRHVQMSLPLLP